MPTSSRTTRSRRAPARAKARTKKAAGSKSRTNRSSKKVAARTPAAAQAASAEPHGRSVLNVDGTEVAVSNLDKIYYPHGDDDGFTKGEMLAYYIAIAPVLLPHMRDRALTMKRYPDGVEGPFFYAKQCPSPRPDFVETHKVARHRKEGEIDYCLVNNMATLVWCANLGNLEMHTFLAKVPDVTRPTQMVFDLDPGPPADAVQCAQVALWIRQMFENLGLKVFAKSSGSKGIQIYVPLNTPTTYEETGPFAKAVAQTLEKAHPELVVHKMLKELRHGKVLVDWSQNSETKTTVCVYSLRAKEKPYVSMPLEWKEIEKCVEEKDATPLFFDARQALARVKEKGDLFAEVLTLKQSLSDAVKAFGGKGAEGKGKSASGKATKGKAAAGDKEEPLAAYKAKRDFTRTAEPAPDKPKTAGKAGGRNKTHGKSKSDKQLLFVIQKHDATSLHYDFRLELDGVLKSWAVPKGPPTDLETKRLALMVEDHPYDYADFEGIIPKGNYGGGTVMVWDTGTWENLGPEPHEGLRSGKLHFRLTGKKLNGEWALVRMHGPRATKGNEWLLLKHGESMKPISARLDDTSALSGRTMAQIAKAPEREWESNRAS